jgi:hypothetical protein
MPICKLCGANANLVDAHIIPVSFFRAINRGGGPLQLVSNDPTKFPKRAPIGVYDQNLVCNSCEERFGPWDSYAADLLINRRDGVFIPFVSADGKIPPATMAVDIDFPKMRLFVLSLLWRAASSTHPYFARIQVAAQLPKLQTLVHAADVGRQVDFATVFTRWTDLRSILDGQFISDPFEYSLTQTGAHMARFYVGAFALDIQLDNSQLPEALAELALARERPLYAVHRSLVGSHDLNAVEPALRNVAQRAKNAKKP